MFKQGNPFSHRTTTTTQQQQQQHFITHLEITVNEKMI